jgi:iron complex transport system substrate-binding protein
VTYLGEILNKQEEAKKALSSFKEKIVKAKETLNQKGIDSQTFSIFEASSKGTVWVYGDKWGRGGDLIYSQLGLKAPDVIQKEIIGKDQYRELSLESVQDYSGDYIIFSGELGSLADNPVWNSIPAVKAGNIIPIDEDLFYDIDLYSSSVQLDYFMKELISK